jgi:predicted naringenin-chalcone synthase
MEKIVYISDFHSIRPSFESTQQETLNWLVEAHVAAEKGDVAFRAEMKENLARYGCKPGKIEKRGHVTKDYLHLDWNSMEVFRLNEHKAGADLGVRLKLYGHHADRIFESFYENVTIPPEDLIHVSCTGYVSPSGAQKIVSKKQWGKETTVTHAYHMGCYGAIAALRIGKGLLFSDVDKERTDIVHTEICSIHANPSHHKADQLVSQSLFADGFIKYSLLKQAFKPAIKVHVVREELIPDSVYGMTWNVGERNFEMSLAREVPVLIARALTGYLERLSESSPWTFDELCKQAIFAIHPGGPKILQHVQELLKLSNKQMMYSEAVLQKMGNMSSATIPHVWNDILNKEPDRTPIVSLAFGPGLTICGAIMEVSCGGRQ